MEKVVNNYGREREFHVFVASTFTDLTRYRKSGDTMAFNKLLLKAMPEVERYVQKRLNRALANNQIDRGKYMAEDFIDQLFIEVYDHLDEVGSAYELHPWLFKKADELLEDTLIEEEFDALFFDNIDGYSKPEWDAMEEKFSTDGDGDLVVMEELDDISYHQKEHLVKNVFLEDEREEMMAKLDKDLEAINIRKHIDTVLYQLPSSMQAVFELFTEHQFDLREIAAIRNRTVQEVEKLLEAARESLRISFLKRYEYRTS